MIFKINRFNIIYKFYKTITASSEYWSEMLNLSTDYLGQSL